MQLSAILISGCKRVDPILLATRIQGTLVLDLELVLIAIGLKNSEKKSFA